MRHIIPPPTGGGASLPRDSLDDRAPAPGVNLPPHAWGDTGDLAHDVADPLQQPLSGGVTPPEPPVPQPHKLQGQLLAALGHPEVGEAQQQVRHLPGLVPKPQGGSLSSRSGLALRVTLSSAWRLPGEAMASSSLSPVSSRSSRRGRNPSAVTSFLLQASQEVSSRHRRRVRRATQATVSRSRNPWRLPFRHSSVRGALRVSRATYPESTATDL